VAEPSNPQPFPRKIRDGITFNNVSFNYPGSSKDALQNINIKILPNSIVALVGENGSGKTTLIKLICRLYDPRTGTVTIDGIDIRLFLTSELRKAISIIFQDFAHYNLTVRENIWIGDINLSPKHEKILDASQRSGANNVISRLKNGYETCLGKWFKDGEEISSGEWQKIALARAFLRDSPIIILDEPTSSIDPIAENEIFKYLRELAACRCLILISHKLSVARMADKIYVLRDGKIIETGSHEELIRCDGAYAKMFEAQAKNYIQYLT
ncbi:MAG: ABC transporter ATP-binding protein/permease, partial [Methanotrichaceae archaeon]|nr:ABC transporter ATP-binding protein/permease [Methanotrichaceae archaeon]